MYSPDFEGRLNTASKIVDPHLNCHGLTFYLLGLRNMDEEVQVDPTARSKPLRKYFEIIEASTVPVSEAPQEAQAFALYRHYRGEPGQGHYIHSGIIHPNDRKTVIHRLDLGEPVTTMPLEEVLGHSRYNIPDAYVELRFLRIKQSGTVANSSYTEI
ncbi:MAG TPA: hypothetical protein VHE53_02655 [Patescibacteria group bacterium]|nr:hypothetical protein [Patescibacteria group bacterium]